jgi:hypothetical protein
MSSKLQSVNETPNERDRRLGIKCPKDNYHWSELKSSLYVKYMINDQQKRNYLRDNWRIILEILMPQQLERNQIIDQFIISNQYLDIDDQQYPIGGYLPKLFRQIATLVDPQQKRDVIMNDLFAIYNLIRWYGISLGNGIFTQAEILALPSTNTFSIFYYMFHGIQTPIARTIQYIRGKRTNYKHLIIKSSQIGITSLEDEELLRDNANPHNPTYHPPWLHTGQSECRMSYTGQYGAAVKYSRLINLQTGAYGSLQCGISGSAQFTLFFVLTAIVCGMNWQTSLNDLFKFIFDSALIFLLGDGGHNMYEILFGLTTSIIILNKILQPNIVLLQRIISTSIFNTPPAFPDGRVLNFLQQNQATLVNFETTIRYFYQLTVNVNPTLDYRDLRNVNQVDVWNYVRDNVLSQNYNYNEQAQRYNDDYKNIVEFLSTDNNRYQQTFIDNDTLLQQLLEPVYKNLAEQRVAQKMLECNLENLSDYTDRSREIFYAFKKSKRTTRKSSKKSRTTRKSSKKSKRTTRKSSKKSRTTRKSSKKSKRTTRKSSKKSRTTRKK